MIHHIEDIPKEEIEVVSKLISRKIDFPSIESILSIRHEELLYIINYLQIPEIYYSKYLAKYTLNNESLLVISDTHLGSRYENINYLDLAYDYAKKNNINSIIHCGDLAQGNMTNVDKKYKSPIHQAKHIVKIYPYDESINNYILFGNHDYNLLSKPFDIMSILNERKDFKFLGIKNAYLNWKNLQILIHHTTDKIKVNIPVNSKTIPLILRGHSHKFKLNENTIYVPTLSDDLLDQSIIQDEDHEPGFLEVSKQNNEIHIKRLIVNTKVEQTKSLFTKV